MSGHGFRVWAPHASNVDLVLDGSSASMARRPGGWWSAPRPPGEGEIDYAYSLDGGHPRPDPRSPWQPQGVNAPSRTFDAAAFPWTDDDWRGPRGGTGVLGGVLYELHLGTFTGEGTCDAAIAGLGHLVELGVDVVEVMPVAAFDGSHGWGYDGVQPYAVQEAYGGPEGFQRFVDACHAVGLGVCLDVVYNHLGPTGNYLAEFGPYFTDAHHTPWGPAVNLDGEGSSEVRRWIIDNALRWFEDFHLDALRLDAVHELRDTSARHVLADLSDETAALAESLGRPLDLIAESDLNDPLTITPVAVGGMGMTAQWDDDVHHALHVALTGERSGYYEDFGGGTAPWPDGGPLSVLAKTLTEVFFHDGRISTFRGRRWGAPVDPTMSRHHFIAYLQNHDQVGNRATGDRIGQTASPGLQAIGAALYLLSPYTPMIFMGEEWRASTPFQFFTSFDEDALAAAVREGRRSEFARHGWRAQDVPDPQDPGTRAASVLDWSERRAPGHVEMLYFYRELIRVRRSHPDLHGGGLDSISVIFDESDEWLIMSRGRIQVVANVAPRRQLIRIDREMEQVLVAWGRAPIVGAEGITLDGHGVVVVRAR